MSASYELQVESQESRRRLLRKIMLYLAIAFVLLVGSACLYLTQPLLGTVPRTASAEVDPQRLEVHLKNVLALSPRDFGHPANLMRVADYIQRQFEQAGSRVSDQSFEIAGVTYRNVIAAYGPDVAERIVIGAHYDTAGPYPGADDNASGIAGLLELARLLAEADLPLKVELVAFTLEEPPFFRTRQMGSAMHAASLRQAGVKVRAMLCLEMIGFFSDREGSQRLPIGFLSLFYPTRGNFISVVGKVGQASLVRRIKRAMTGAIPLPVYSINGPAFIPGMDFSDHLNYWREGMPAAMITDTAFYRNPNYHLPGDTPEKLDYSRMAEVVAGVYAAVLDLAR